QEPGPLVRPRRATPDDLQHLPAAHAQRIGDQRAMAPPRHRLGAHHRGPLRPRRFLQLGQRPRERFRLHVIRIAAEAGILPTGILRIGPRVPQSPKPRPRLVLDAGLPQARRQLLAAELRVRPRFRNRPHIRHQLDPLPLQQPEELLNRPRRVPNRPNRLHGPPATSRIEPPPCPASPPQTPPAPASIRPMSAPTSSCASSTTPTSASPNATTAPSTASPASPAATSSAAT